MKKSIFFCMLSVAALSLCGCLNPHLSSMGASQMIVAHQPRMDAQGDSSLMSLSVDGFGGAKMTGRNIKDGYSFGANALLNYKAFGSSSPFYLETALGGKAGEASLKCSESGKCNDLYNEWLLSDEGKNDFSFWSLQERLGGGADFDLGQNAFIGIKGGLQMFQGGGDFDDVRDKLGKNMADNDDEGYGLKIYSSVYAGARLGQYGTIVLEGEAMWLKTMNFGFMLNYFHPSGFHGGIFAAEKVGYGVNFGKSFSF